MFINNHIHIFNLRHAPSKFLSLYIKNENIASTLQWLLGKKLSNKLLISAIEKMGGAEYSKYAAFLRVGTKSTSDMIFDDIANHCSYPAASKFVCLPVDFSIMGAGRSDVSYDQQMQDLFEVKKRYPDQCLPFAFAHPLIGTPDQNRDNVKKYIEKGCVGIKLYPSLGYYPSDPGMKEIYQYACDLNLPLITHCSTGGIYYKEKPLPPSFMNPTDLDGNPIMVDMPDAKADNDTFCNVFVSPDRFRPVLDKFPNLKLCLAHYGSDVEFEKELRKRPVRPNFYSICRDMLLAKNDDGSRKYPNLYVDISYTLNGGGKDFPFYKLIKADLENPELADRILYGTDYFMTLQEMPENALLYNCLKQLGQPLFDQMQRNNQAWLASSVY
jgi:predicted TIM-barrel fold metal-dependent hydrolase